MSEQPRKGRTFIASNLKKESILIDRDGREIEVPKKHPKTLQELIEKRNRMMGRN